MVADDFINDKAQKFFGKLRVQSCFLRQLTQARDLPFFTCMIRGGQLRLCFIAPNILRNAKPLGQHMDKRCIDIVDALSETGKHFIGHDETLFRQIARGASANCRDALAIVTSRRQR